jgi:hypothetical protein
MSKRGGKRPGAGRPARETPREALTLRIEPEAADRFRQICANRGKSQSEMLTAWIQAEQIQPNLTAK